MALRNEQTSTRGGNPKFVRFRKRWWKKQTARWRRRQDKTEPPPKKYTGWVW